MWFQVSSMDQGKSQVLQPIKCLLPLTEQICTGNSKWLWAEQRCSQQFFCLGQRKRSHHIYDRAARNARKATRREICIFFQKEYFYDICFKVANGELWLWVGRWSCFWLLGNKADSQLSWQALQIVMPVISLVFLRCLASKLSCCKGGFSLWKRLLVQQPFLVPKGGTSYIYNKLETHLVFHSPPSSRWVENPLIDPADNMTVDQPDVWWQRNEENDWKHLQKCMRPEAEIIFPS